MSGWSAVARLTWLAVIGLAAALVLVLVVWPEARGMDAPSTPQEWLMLAALTLLAVYLGLFPLKTAPDRRLTAASAPVIALALLFDTMTAVCATAGAGLVCQLIRQTTWYVTAFNVAQRTIAVTLAAWTCTGLLAAFALPFYIPCVAAVVGYFVVNTAAVSAMSAARKKRSWWGTWLTMAREQVVGELALLACGALVAIHARTAPLAVPLLVPPLWLAWRVLVGAVEIKRLNASLHETLEQQKAFVANASHELRTPIASLRAQLEMLRGQVASSPRAELAERVDDLAHETARVGALLSNLLVLEHSDSGIPLKRERVNLEDVLFAVYRELRPLAGQVNLNVRLDDDSVVAPMVIGDDERLRQLLLNLGANALRFTPPDGAVEIRCGASGDTVRVTVSDTGVGIGAEHFPRIFDRFYRVDRGRARDQGLGGSGLGLSIVKSIVDAHGGTITAESEVGKGSTFTVVLPLAPAEAPAPVRSGARAATAGAR